jgi:Family of unknown function (DUF5719)
VRRLVANRYVLALLVVIALGAEFGLASLSHHPAALAAGPRTPAPARATVSAALRACPSPGSAGATASGLAMAAASSGTGQAQVTRLSPAGVTTAPAPLHVLTQPGQLSLVNVATAPALPRGLAQTVGAGAPVPTSPERGGVMISATGSMARGLEAEQTSAGGLGTAPCLGPGTDFWFVGPGTKSAADIELYLMNTDGQAADASVQVLTDSGPVLGSTDAGIGVPPHGMVVQSLAGLVHGSRDVALNVTTSVGRVVAAVLETSGPGQPGAWLPASEPPATTQVLPGLPGTPGGRELYVAVPGSGNAQIKVTAITAKGSYAPTGGTGIELPGGSAVSVALPSLGGIAGAIKVSSNVPVAASMSVPGGAAGAPGAFTAAAAPVQEQGVIAGNPGGPGGGTSSLVLSAPRGAAQVQLTELTATGQAATGASAPHTIGVLAGHSVVVTLAAPRQGGKSSTFAVVVTPMAGSGPVYAGRVVSQAGVIRSILPVMSSLTWVPLPAVRSSATAALP